MGSDTESTVTNRPTQEEEERKRKRKRCIDNMDEQRLIPGAHSHVERLEAAVPFKS